MRSKMKSEIILCFVWGVCINTVASYHPYPDHGYQQGTYQQNPEWPNNQNFPQNLGFPARQPPANYEASQSVVNYVQGSPQANYEQEGTYPETPEESVYVQHPREAIFHQQFPKQVEQSQSDVYVEPASPPQIFAEAPRTYTAPLDRSHESYGASPQPSQWLPPPPPPNPAFVDGSFPPQVPRHWIPQNSNSYPPINHQEPNFRSPQWQSTGPQKNQYYGSTYDGQNNAPLQSTPHKTEASSASASSYQEIHENQGLIPVFKPNQYYGSTYDGQNNAPLQSTPHKTQASSASASSYQEIHENQGLIPVFKPNQYHGSTYDGQNNAPLQSTPHKTQASSASASNYQEIHEHQNKQFQVNLPKVHNIVVIEDDSESSRSGGTEFQEKNQNIRQENLNNKNGPNPPDMIMSELNNIKNMHTNSREFNLNSDVLSLPVPNVVKETYPGTVPVNDRYIDNNSYQKHDSIKTNSEIYPKESNVASTVVHNYRLIPVFKPTHPQENKVVEPNIVPPQSPPAWKPDVLPLPVPNVLKETYPGAVPVNEKYIDNNNYQKHENYPKESHEASFKPTHPHENKVVKPNIVPPQSPPVLNNNYNNHLRQPAQPQAATTQTDKLLAVKNTNDKKYENIEEDTKKYYEPLNPLKEKTVFKYHEALVSHLDQPNTNINLNPPTINATKLNNNQSPTFNSLPTNEKNKYLNNPLQNPNNIRNTIVQAEYTAKPSYVKTTDAPNPLDEPITTLPYQYLNQAKTFDEFDTSSKLAPPKTINNENLENKDQTKVYMQEPNNYTSSNAQNNQEDANPSTNEFNINATNILTTVIDKNTHSENITATNNTVEIKLNSTNTQNYETYSDDNDDDTLDDFKTGSSATVDDIAKLYLDEKEDTLKENFSIYIDTINDDDNETTELPENSENINLEKEATSDIKSDEKEVADFPKHLSKAMFWIRPDEGFWDDFYSENQTEPYDDMYMCNVKFTDLIIERTSKFYMHKNGTFVEETEEIIWEHKDDAVPREIKTTKTMRNPEPKNRPKKKKADALEAPKCSKQPKA